MTTTDTVYDTKTHLTWERKFASPRQLGSKTEPGTAKNYCATLGLDGGGWRLPTVKEFYTLMDVTAFSGIDSSAFPGVVQCTLSGEFWSSSPSMEPCEPGWGWAFGFNNGGVALSAPPNAVSSVRCVR